MIGATYVLRSCICLRVRQLDSRLSRQFNADLRRVGLGVSQFGTLVVLKIEGPISNTRLSHALGLERTTLLRKVAILRRRKWVGLVHARGKRYHVALTQAGTRVLERGLPAWKRAHDSFCRHVGRRRSAQLCAILNKVLASWDRS